MLRMYVFVHVALDGRGISTLVTLVRLVTRVIAQVLHQITATRSDIRAHGTSVRLFSRVVIHVAHQRSSVGRFVWAEFTLVRFFPRCVFA